MHHSSDGASKILARGMNATNWSYNGTRHAEFMAVNCYLTSPSSMPSSVAPPHSPTISSPSPSPSAGDAQPNTSDIKKEIVLSRKEKLQILREATLYVTVEPCIMCASLLRQFGIKNVFFGAGNEKFGGCGGVLDVHLGNGKRVGEESEGCGGGGELVHGVDERKHQRKKGEGKGDGKGDYQVSGGWLREEAIVLLRRFYVQENERGKFSSLPPFQKSSHCLEIQ